jgi:hypothetical protein
MVVNKKDDEIDYGKPNKRVVFNENEHRHAKFILKYKEDGFKQGKFFRAIITAYIDDDPTFRQFIDTIKPTPKRTQKKDKKLREEGEQLMNDLGLNDGDIDNIFDLIEQEHPDL